MSDTDEAPPATVVLEARAVTKRFGSVTALDGASLSVTEGEAVALVGESGSGKTTLLRCFNRMVEPEAGAIEVAGDPVGERDAVHLRRALGYVQQDGGLLPHWSVLRNVALVPWLQGRSNADDLARGQLELVGLPASEFGARYPRELSGGQRQRAALARALAATPEVLLLDEPFGALDALTRADVQEMFAELRRRLGVTVLLVTHDLHEAFHLADRIAVMRAGRIEQFDTPEVLLADARTPYVAKLLERARLT
ncbi:MAG: ATP-binding cassette domain-containing protein [Gemmatimonadota bacterium]|nr:ATP-binding cassette domain-containing protein [Gemmatimonadota bacterium]